MKDIIDIISSNSDIIHGNPVSEIEIQKAEEILKVKFFEDYSCYVKNFGCMAIDGREFTGISKLPNYDVVTITTTQKQYNGNIPSDWYVVEQLNIDGIVIWQSSTGEIYQTGSNTEPLKICDSFTEYISQL
ncbi:MAG: SMI1/KNR4 family protein [Firmicutes bacterium]|nr:SMI1/KNR4 family protein [Bacillota bacterium]